MRLPRLSVPLVTAIALALAVAPAAGAAIVVNRGVDRARIGMTTRQVRAALGTPDLVERSGATAAMVYRSRRRLVRLVAGGVLRFAPGSRRAPTATGAGPGTTLRALRRRVSGEHCGRKAGVSVCKIGSSRSGRRSTVFLIVDGVVDTVSVALAP